MSVKSSRIPKPFAHQAKDTKKCVAQDVVFDISDPGCGKTRTQIDAIVQEIKTLKGKTLVLASKSLLYAAWDNDFNKFAPHVRVSVATAANRAKAFELDADVYVTNFDAVKWLSEQPPKFFKGFTTLIIDEITAFKHATSQRSKAVNKIKKYFKKRRGMTGTPNSNTITDIWHPMFILDDGQRLGRSFFAFRAAVCEPKQVGPQPNMVKWVDKPGIEGAVASLLQDVVIRNVFEECHDIPANMLSNRPFLLSKKQAKAYMQMERTAITLVNNSEIVSGVNAASVTTKLLQIASGAVYSEGDDSKYAVIDTDRYDMVADIIEERTNPCIAFFLWKHQRDELIKACTARGLAYAVIDGSTSDKQRNEIVKDFQQGMYDVLLAHPKSAAHGLTLTRATTTIWTSPTYDLEWFLQGNKRIYRAGQTKKTETICIVATGTIEEKVFEMLTSKNARQVDLLSLLKGMSA